MNFWMDNWVGDRPLITYLSVVGNLNLQVAEVFTCIGPNLHVLRELIPEHVVQLVCDAGITLRQGLDRCVWKLPKKWSFFVWRAKRKAIPVDNIIQQLGISIASKCECCIQPQLESLNHILCGGVGAQKI